MKLSLLEWYQLQLKVDAARAALEEVDREIVRLVLLNRDRPVERPAGATTDHLMKMSRHVETAASAMCVVRDGVTPVSEWVGGERWRWREPQSCYGGLSARRYFTDEEVAEYEQFKKNAAGGPAAS